MLSIWTGLDFLCLVKTIWFSRSERNCLAKSGWGKKKKTFVKTHASPLGRILSSLSTPVSNSTFRAVRAASSLDASGVRPDPCRV